MGLSAFCYECWNEMSIDRRAYVALRFMFQTKWPTSYIWSAMEAIREGK